jgi:ATP-dependent helicase HrpB
VSLPIDDALPQIVSRLRERNVVLVAPPGAGKTTKLPPALLEARGEKAGEIWVLEPRRLAARLAAERVAALLGERVGERCGYQVRFDAAVSDATKIRFVTLGLFVRRIREQPELPGIDTVIIDEFHERPLEADVSLALVRRLQRRRDDLRLVVMSATIQPEPLADFLDADVVRVQGRVHPVEIEYSVDDRPLEARVAKAFRSLVAPDQGGHVLVFLPGAREIRACEATCEAAATATGHRLHVLHGGEARERQLAAVRPSTTPKLILSTNVAETSITIDGVAGVIDSGLARVASDDPWSGVARLSLTKISRASAEQRAGRAGRTRAGRCVRLYSRHDLERRPAFDTPELHRLDLADTVLGLLASGIDELSAMAWFEPPSPAAVEAAISALGDLGALDETGRLTPTGRRMSRFPVSPRLARLLVEAERRGIAGLGAGATALLSERPIQRERRLAAHDADADVLVELDWLRQLRRDPDRARRWGLDPATCRRVEQIRGQLAGLIDRSTSAPPTPHDRERALRMSLLAAFPDRVARVRDDGPDRRVLVSSQGGSARQSESSAVRTAAWVVGLTVEERREPGRRPISVVRSVSAIEPEWLIDMFPERVHDEVSIHFDEERERVVGRSELRYGQLVIESSSLRRLPSHASEVLAEAALAAGPERFVGDPTRLAQWVARVAFARRFEPAIEVMDETRIRETLIAMCEGRASFAEITNADLLAHLRAGLGDVAASVDSLAPTHVRLPGGRRAPISYEPDRDPWIASRLQDFFGMRDGPRVGRGVPLVLHLRAPNGRDVQVTTDLAGFWERHYPGLRRTLMRRYPKHDWPEDPLSASPPTARGRSRPRRK